MSRAVLLPAGSDPFVLAYWLRNFATWSQYVDRLYIAICGPLEPEPLAYIKGTLKKYPKARVTFERTPPGKNFPSRRLQETCAMRFSAPARRPIAAGEFFSPTMQTIRSRPAFSIFSAEPERRASPA